MGNTTVEIVSDYLDDLERLLQHADAASVAVMAPAELRRTLRALRAILAKHCPGPDAYQSSGFVSRLWWRAWQQICSSSAWQVAYQHLIAASPVDPTGPIDAVGGPR
ncbi:hypothetical protein [Promicromonospora sp. NPDC023987]|uniref:hypothetical protein n=1 Tax=Promicromonospora sp. NPDC023987 TaxID=3155360 RepID=UPI00340E67A9